jgi:phosphoenolpyruvate carboxylase
VGSLRRRSVALTAVKVDRLARTLRDRRRRLVDRPLRDDVRLLGRLLGEVLNEHEGAALFELEEKVRKLAIARRRGPRRSRASAHVELSRLLASLPVTDATRVVRAFAVYFRLANLAEQHHRVRRARAHAEESSGPQRGSLAAALQDAKARGVTASRAREAISSLEVTLALTAHPSQAERRTVLEKLYRVAQHLETRDRCRLTPRETAELLAAIREEIGTLWRTDELRRERPSVGDEVKNVLWYVEEILWHRLPELSAALCSAFEQTYGEPLELLAPPLRLHSWVGGDMDGNPRVTPEVLAEALRLYRARGLSRLLSEARALGAALSHSTRHVGAPRALLESIEEDVARMPAVAARETPRTEGEPWRRKLGFIEARLAAGLAEVEARADRGDAPPYRRAADLERDLATLADALHETGCARAGERRVRAVLDRVRALGLSLVELENRVAAGDVRRAAEVVASGESPEAGAAQVLGGLREIARGQAELGEACCRTIVVSMVAGADDMLATLACARAAGLWNDERASATVDLVPLFETHQALSQSSEILQQMLADPVYRAHVAARGVQEIMVGYSDSGKEVGLLAANAALRRALIGLRTAAAAAGVPLRIFHGRGETVARGGGPAQAAIFALPPGTVAGRYKATEQGEALDHKYARPELAMRTLELIVGGALLHSLDAQPMRPAEADAPFEAAFDELADVGRRAYRALVWDDTRFVEFFRASTPIEEIASLPLGSRPASRSRGGGVESLRAIPWVFAWVQTRAILPAWYGVGSALEAVATRPEGASLLRRMLREWPFFRTVLSNVEMVLAKTDLDIAEHYASLAPEPVRAAVWPRIRDEHTRVVRWILELKRSAELLDDSPILQRSIALRNPYVDPMSLLQVELLRRKRAGDEACDRAIMLTVNGIAAGMRNTG